MSYEWPLSDAAAVDAPDDAAAPLRFFELIAQVRECEAVEAFARRRAGQIRAGHTLESDLAKAPAHIALRAKHSLSAFIEVVGPQRMNLPPLTRAECLARVEAAGAVLIALWERLQVEVDPDRMPVDLLPAGRGE